MGRKRHGKKSTMEKGTVDTQSQRDDDTNVFTCETSPIYGRYLKSKGTIPAGALILSEKYLIAGPMRSSGLVCLGCHNSKMKRRLSCPSCHWPICTVACSKSSFHQDECRFFTEHKIKPPEIQGLECTFDFGSITVLRGLLLKLNDSDGWKTLLTLEHHNDIRKTLPLWKENEENIVKPLREGLGLASFFNELEIHSICGILEVNSFELGEDFSYRGVFSTAAMMAHDCIPNSTHFEDSVSGVMEVRAAVDIPPTTPITVSYAYTLEGTVQRRQMLQETKFFDCVCERCCDPTEISTHMSTFICPKCLGYVLHVKNKDGDKLWRCSSCNSLISSLESEKIGEKFATKEKSVSGIKASEDFLIECSKHFHSNHFIPFGVKFNLCQAYGREGTALQELSQVELERKHVLCLQVLQILNIVVPGMTITRGLVLYELQATEIILARRIFESQKFSKALLKRKLEQALKTLEEAINILSLAHSSTLEHSMAMSAKTTTLPDLKRWIQIVKSK